LERGIAIEPASLFQVAFAWFASECPLLFVLLIVINGMNARYSSVILVGKPGMWWVGNRKMKRHFGPNKTLSNHLSSSSSSSLCRNVAHFLLNVSFHSPHDVAENDDGNLYVPLS
jgi:hypothetical protein